MHRLLAGIICALWVVGAQAQITAAMFMPTPLGVILSIGQWITFETKKVYYIEVAGDGPTEAEARTNGFRLAVEQAIGSLISSETEVQNGRLVRDEIINYAAGYVEKFEVVNVRNYNGGVRVTMKVWVVRSALADRLLNKSEKSSEIDGARASVQLATINRERSTGDQLVATVLKDFPRRAFDIEIQPADIVRNQSQAAIEIPFKITWNQDYLRSLWAVLDATSSKSSNTVSVIGLNSGSLFGFGGQARYDDTVKFNLLVNAMANPKPAVLFTLRAADNRVLYRQCSWWTPWNFVEVNIYRPAAFVNGAAKVRATAKIPVSPEVLEAVNRVEIDVVNESQCSK